MGDNEQPWYEISAYAPGSAPTAAPVYSPGSGSGDSADYKESVAATQPLQGWDLMWDYVYDANITPSPSGDAGDHWVAMGGLDRGVQTAIEQWEAAKNSPYSARYHAPNPEIAVNQIGWSVQPPADAVWTYVPGMPPDVVMDVNTGDVYRFRDDAIVYAGNITMPVWTEIQRATATVMSELTKRGVLNPAVPHVLPDDHGWKSSTRSGVPKATVANPHAPTLEEIGATLMYESNTAWVQRDRSQKRMTMIPLVTLPFTLPVGAAAASATSAAAGGGLLGGAAAAGVSAGIGGLNSLLTQLIGQQGDLSEIDWTGIASDVLISGVSNVVGDLAGVGAKAAGLGNVDLGIVDLSLPWVADTAAKFTTKKLLDPISRMPPPRTSGGTCRSRR